MPYGTVNADVVQSSVSGVSLGAGNASIMKNRIINGAMVIDQRNAGTYSAYANNSFIVDRFQYVATQSSKLVLGQNLGVAPVTPPVGFTKYLGMQSQSAYSIGSGDIFLLKQAIEGFNIADLAWGTASAKTVTLSFQVYSSLTGTFGGSLVNGSSNRSYPFTYTISSANTWTSISITIDGDTTGTWATDNSAGIYVGFGLGVGSTYSGTAGSWAGANYLSATGATSVVGTNGATFYITGVQLEVGSSATGFEYRQYTTELQLCQRYYESTIGAGETTSTFSVEGFRACAGSFSGSSYYGPIIFRVNKRTTPTVTFYDDSRNSGYLQGYGGSSASLAATAQNLSSSGCTGSIAVTGYNFVQGNWVASAEL